MQRLLVLLVLTLFVSCTPKVPPNTSLEGKLAIQGRAVVVACDGILSAADAAVTAKTLQPAQALPVAQACKIVGQAGQKLATALRVLDTVNSGPSRDAASAESKSLLQTMADAVTNIPATTQAILKDPVGSFFSAVATLRGMLPQ